jgi:TonB-dependent receptor
MIREVHLFLKSFALVTASSVAMMGSLAWAQAPAEEEAEARQDVIVVEGVRQSIERAIDVKRNAETVVEAVTFEDLGNFADDSIASAIQRIPGVQVETNDGGTAGDRVSLRGLGPQFVNSTINGRRVLSPGGEGQRLRNVNFDVFPPSVLSGVRVAKGQTAARPESGLAGLVDLQTLRPLEFGGLKSKTVAGSLKAQTTFNDVSEEWGERVDGLVALRNEAGTVGGYLAAVWGDENAARYQIRVARANRDLRIIGQTDTIAASVPNNIVMNPIRENRKRQAISAGLQFQPNSEWDILFDTTLTEYDNRSDRLRSLIQFGPVYGGTQFELNALDIDPNGTLQAFDFANSVGGGAPRGVVSALIFDNKTTNSVSGVNADWEGDKWGANFDLSYSTVEYEQDLRFVDARTNLDKAVVAYDGRGEIPLISFGANYLDPAGYAFSRARVRGIEVDGENFGLKAAFDYELDHSAFSSLEFGISYDQTDIESNRTASSDPGVPAANRGAVASALIVGGLIDPFLDGTNASPSQWLLTDFASAAAVDSNLNADPFEVLSIDPAQSFAAEESILALFGQLNIGTNMFGKPVTGNIGVRAVQTDSTFEGLVVDNGGTPTPTEISEDYWEVLPSANLNFELRDNFNLRLGYGKTLTRPEYNEAAPAARIGSPGAPGEVGSIDVGNPALSPIIAQNFDITFEWYNDYDGAVVGNLFYKDVSDFIVETTLAGQTFPGQGTDLFDITTPVNFSDGEVQGFEIGFYQPLSIFSEALSDFGVQANYTYVDSSFDEDVGDAGIGFPGASENNLNAIAFYETDLLTVRVAYVYRDDFFRELAGTGSQTDQARFTEAQGSVDVNVSVRPIDKLSLALNVRNLNDEVRRDYVGDPSVFLDYFDRGRRVSLSASYKF